MCITTDWNTSTDSVGVETALGLATEMAGSNFVEQGLRGRVARIAKRRVDGLENGHRGVETDQVEKRKRGELMGIGISSFTEIVGAGPSKHFDILGLKMFDSAELRVHPTGKAVVRVSCMSQGQGHETTFAQIVAEEIGIPPGDIQVVNGDTDQTPFGLGTYGSRSTPVSGAAAAMVARKVRDKARIIASGMLEVSVADLEWQKGSFNVKGDPAKSVTIQDIAMRAHGAAWPARPSPSTPASRNAIWRNWRPVAETRRCFCCAMWHAHWEYR